LFEPALSICGQSWFFYEKGECRLSETTYICMV
jgi:hypothetical protein